jgi:ArsR family transcriptional regulator
MEHSEKNIAMIFKAPGDPNRIHILKILCGGETCCCKLLEQLQITQPTLSHHMKILCDAELVTGRKDGKWIHYSIRCEGVRQVREMAHEVLLPDCKCIETEERGTAE